MYPRLDEAATEQAGQPLELLTRIRSQQPFSAAGPRLSQTAVELLSTAVSSGRWPMRNVKREGADELIAAGLMDSRGRISPAGNALGEVWRDARGMVTVTARHGAHRTWLRCWIAPGAAVISAGCPLATLGDAAALGDAAGAELAMHTLQMVGVGQVMDVVARWIGIAPAWTFAIEPGEISSELFEARLADPSTPVPENANAYLRRLWAEPWTMWQIAFGMNQEAPGLGMITAGTLGYVNYAVRPDDGVVSFIAMPPALLYTELYARFGTSLSGPQTQG